MEPRYRTLVLTAAYVGLRWGELADERIADGLDDTLHHSLAVRPRSRRGQEVFDLSR